MDKACQNGLILILTVYFLVLGRATEFGNVDALYCSASFWGVVLNLSALSGLVTICTDMLAIHLFRYSFDTLTIYLGIRVCCYLASFLALCFRCSPPYTFLLL